MDLLHNKRIRSALVIASIFALTITTEKWQEMGGKEGGRGKLTLLKCFDMGSGTVSCTVKEGVKLYLYLHKVRGSFVEKVRHRAMEAALVDALGQGMSPRDAARQAQRDGEKAAKRRARHVIGPIVSAMWDMVEVGYYGGSKVEGIVRGFGTLCGTYAGGLVGEQRLGRVGYVVGSHLGSWFGGRVGIMVYDVLHGIDYLIRFVVGAENHNVQEDKLRSGVEI